MREKFTIWLAWHLPRYLVYWCAVRLISEASVSKKYENTVLSELTAMDALNHW
jgi:hypothetical protein